MLTAAAASAPAVSRGPDMDQWLAAAAIEFVTEHVSSLFKIVFSCVISIQRYIFCKIGLKDFFAPENEKGRRRSLSAGLPRRRSAVQKESSLKGRGRHRHYRLPLSSAEARRTSERNSDL